MKMHQALLVIALTGLLVACGPSGNETVKAKQASPERITTRWKWEAKSAVATSKGLIIEQTGDKVHASFVYLKDGDGFVVDRAISVGRYYPEKRLIVLPPGPVLPE